MLPPFVEGGGGDYTGKEGRREGEMNFVIDWISTFSLG